MATSQSQCLVFDVVGPMLIQFQKGAAGAAGAAWIYAPCCEDHTANLLTDRDDIPLFGLAGATAGSNEGYVYTFAEASSPAGANQHQLSVADAKELLLLKYTGTGVPKGSCHFMFRAPCPDYVVPLFSEEVWIHRNNATTWVTNPDSVDPQIVNSPRARGLRLFYQSCVKPPAITCIDYPSGSPIPDFSGFNPETRVPPASGFPMPAYYITLRFSSNHAIDQGRGDAYFCFLSMRMMCQTIADLVQWRADFVAAEMAAEGLLRGTSVGAARAAQTPAPHILVDGNHPHDCHATQIVAQDW